MMWLLVCFLMQRRPPISKSTDTLFPDTTPFRSVDIGDAGEVDAIGRVGGNRAQPLRQLVPLAREQEAFGIRLVGGVWEKDRHDVRNRSEEHTSELQSLMRNSYAVFCLKKTKHT